MSVKTTAKARPKVRFRERFGPDENQMVTHRRDGNFMERARECQTTCHDPSLDASDGSYLALLSPETIARINALQDTPKTAAEGGPVDSSLAEPVPAKEGE